MTDGKPVHQGIDQSKLVPLLTAALQEAIGEIEIAESSSNCGRHLVPFSKMLGVGSPLVRTGGQRTWKVGSIPARPLAS
jgi:hypothetical protein